MRKGGKLMITAYKGNPGTAKVSNNLYVLKAVKHQDANKAPISSKTMETVTTCLSTRNSLSLGGRKGLKILMRIQKHNQIS